MTRNAKSLLFIGTSLVVMLAVGPPCSARTLWVDIGSAAPLEDGSPEKPFRAINAAIEVVQPGDTVMIRAGTYREQFRIPSDEPGKPITVRAADGERVIVAGCVRLDGWQPAGGGVWVTTLDWKPDRLLIGGKTQTIAREPNAGWWRSAGATDDGLVDLANLSGIQAHPTGGEVRVWLQRGNVFQTFPIRSLDNQSGRVTLDEIDRPGMLTDGDKYYLQNRARLIDRPSEWAVEPDGGRFKVSFMPRDESDLDRVEAPFLDESAVTVRPGLEEKPVKGWLLANWGENRDFRLDLRLAAGSPGASRSAASGPVGSEIDIQAYLRSDFDGDGTRDLPPLPPELEQH
jgi:hypothetical protein